MVQVRGPGGGGEDRCMLQGARGVRGGKVGSCPHAQVCAVRREAGGGPNTRTKRHTNHASPLPPPSVPWEPRSA